MSSAQILMANRTQSGLASRDAKDPPMSTPPLFIDSRIEPMKPFAPSNDIANGPTTSKTKSISPNERLSTKGRKCSSSVTSHSASSNSIGELRNVTSKCSLSGNSSNGSIDSSCLPPGSRQRNKLRPLPNKNRMSASSLTSLNNSSSNSSLASIRSSSSILHSGRHMRRQHSRSFDHLRESMRQGKKSSASLRKNASFESVSSLRKKASSSSSFSRTSSNGSCNSSSNNSSTNFSWNSKGMVQMAQRSNGSTVKGVIDELQRIVDETLALAVNEVDESEKGKEHTEGTNESKQEEQVANDQTQPRQAPVMQCSMLSQWALADAYYKVVITKYRGIPIIIRAMKAFPDDEDIQGACCVLLTSLTNKVQVFQEGGVDALLDAMKSHPNSIVVQSAALEGILALMPLVMHLEENNREMISNIEKAAKLAQEMYLTEAGNKAVEELLVQCAKLSR